MPNRLLSKPRGRSLSLDDHQRLLDQSPSLVCIGGFDGYLKQVPPAAAAALGYTPQEMTSVPMIELVHPDDRPWAGGLLADFAGGQSVRSVEVRIRAKDGSYKWILWDAVPRIEEGFFLAMGQDITARKEVEQELRESQQRFHLIASATDEGIWDWDLRADRVWRNEAYHKAFGVPDDATEGTIEWWRSRIHPDDLERVLALIPAPIVEGTQKWVLEYRMRRGDGTYAHVYDRGFVIFDHDGTPVRMVGSVIDISKLKQAEQELRESEERFRLAARATRDPIFDWDMRKGKVWRSEGFETLFGYAHESVSDDLSWWIEQTHPDDRDRVCAAVSSVESDTNQQHAIEYRFRRADGTYADVLERAFMMYGDDGKPARMVGSLMDISQRRRAEEMLHMQQAELAHIARVSTMGEIATGLAHELNQPLAAIANYAEGCLQALGSQAPDREKKSAPG